MPSQSFLGRFLHLQFSSNQTLGNHQRDHLDRDASVPSVVAFLEYYCSSRRRLMRSQCSAIQREVWRTYGVTVQDSQYKHVKDNSLIQKPILPKDYKGTIEAQAYQKLIFNYSVVLTSFREARLCPLSQDSLLACFYIRTFFSAAMRSGWALASAIHRKI